MPGRTQPLRITRRTQSTGNSRDNGENATHGMATMRRQPFVRQCHSTVDTLTVVKS